VARNEERGKKRKCDCRIRGSFKKKRLRGAEGITRGANTTEGRTTDEIGEKGAFIKEKKGGREIQGSEKRKDITKRNGQATRKKKKEKPKKKIGKKGDHEISNQTRNALRRRCGKKKKKKPTLALTEKRDRESAKREKGSCIWRKRCGGILIRGCLKNNTHNHEVEVIRLLGIR